MPLPIPVKNFILIGLFPQSYENFERRVDIFLSPSHTQVFASIHQNLVHQKLSLLLH